MTIFDLWVKANFPCPPFHFYTSCEFDSSVQIDAVIFHNPPCKPKIEEEVDFFQVDSDGDSNCMSKFDGHSIHVSHDKKYQFKSTEGYNQ